MEAASSPEVARSTFQSIPINKVKPSRHQARKQFNEDSIKALAISMRQEGLLQPITVRRVGDVYELIGGERRLRAARFLGWPTIDAKVIQTVSEGEAAAKGLIENLQRENLNPIEEAEGFRQLNQLDPKYWDQPQIAAISGRSQEYVSLSLKLLSLPPQVLESIRRRILSRSHGLELIRLQDPKIQLQIAQKMEGLNRDHGRKLVEQALSKGPKSAVESAQKNPINDHNGNGLNDHEDPVTDLWQELLANPDLAALKDWGIAFGEPPQKIPKGQAALPKAWNFWISTIGSPPKEYLADWFRKMAEALSEPQPEPTEKTISAPAEKTLSIPIEKTISVTAEKTISAAEEKTILAPVEKTISNPIEKAISTPEPINHTPEPQLHDSPFGTIRLPKTPEEKNELEIIAAKSSGPGAVYAWIFGSSHKLTQIVLHQTWQSMGVKNAMEGLAKLLDSLKQYEGKKQP